MFVKVDGYVLVCFDVIGIEVIYIGIFIVLVFLVGKKFEKVVVFYII